MKGLFDGWFVVSVVSRSLVHFFGQCFVKELFLSVVQVTWLIDLLVDGILGHLAGCLVGC